MSPKIIYAGYYTKSGNSPVRPQKYFAGFARLIAYVDIIPLEVLFAKEISHGLEQVILYKYN